MTRTRRIATIAVLGLIGMLAGATTATAGGGGHCDPIEGDGDQVDLKGACFWPSTLYADTGESIRFVNHDAFAHNVSGTGWGHYEDMGTGDRFATSFADEGIYPFACTLHPGMNGVVVVGEAGGAALTSGTSGDPQLPTSETSTPPSGEASSGWIAAGVVGMVIGSAVGVGLAETVRRGRVRRTPAESVPAS